MLSLRDNQMNGSIEGINTKHRKLIGLICKYIFFQTHNCFTEWFWG